jgi:hypothetical protein
MSNDSDRLTRLARIFGIAVSQACEEVNVDEEVTIDANSEYVRVLVGGNSKVLFNVNAEGAIRGPILGFHDATRLGSINDDGVEANIAWTIKNELSDQVKRRPAQYKQ